MDTSRLPEPLQKAWAVLEPISRLHTAYQLTLSLAGLVGSVVSAIYVFGNGQSYWIIPMVVALLVAALGASAIIIAQKSRTPEPIPTPVASPRPSTPTATPAPTARREPRPSRTRDRTALEEALRKALSTGLQLQQRIPAPLNLGLRAATWAATTEDDVIEWERHVRDLLHDDPLQQAIFTSEPPPKNIYSGVMPSPEFHRRLSYRLDTLAGIIKHIAA